MSAKFVVFILSVSCVLVKSIDVSEVKGSAATNATTARNAKELHFQLANGHGNIHRGPAPVPRIMPRNGGPGTGFNVRQPVNRNHRQGPPQPVIKRRVQLGPGPPVQTLQYPGNYKATRYSSAKNPFITNGQGNSFNRGPPPSQYRGPNANQSYRPPPQGNRFRPSVPFGGNVVVHPNFNGQLHTQIPVQSQAQGQKQIQQAYQKPLAAYPQQQQPQQQLQPQPPRHPSEIKHADLNKSEFQVKQQVQPQFIKPAQAEEYKPYNNAFYSNQKINSELQMQQQQQQQQQRLQIKLQQQQQQQQQQQMQQQRLQQQYQQFGGGAAKKTISVRQGDSGYSVYEPETEENARPHFSFPKSPNSILSEEAKRYLDFMGSKDYFLPKQQPDYRTIMSTTQAAPPQSTARPAYYAQHSGSLQNYRTVSSSNYNAYLPKEVSESSTAKKAFKSAPDPERIEFTESDAIHSSYTNSPVRKYPTDQHIANENNNRRHAQHVQAEEDDNPNEEIMLATGSDQSTHSRTKIDTSKPKESPSIEQEDTEDYCERICSGVHDDDEEVICGSDGYMYTSEAQLECYASCLNIDVTIQGKGSCTQV